MQNDNVTNKLNGAGSGDTLRFFPGTYEVNLVLEYDDVTLKGVDTKNTILKSKDGSSPVITVNGSNASIENFTLLDSELGILVDSPANGPQMKNNVFRLGRNNIAIELNNTNGSEIINNTFYGNLLDIRNSSISTVIKNNIFSNYETLIQATGQEIIAFNCMEKNETAYDNNGNRVNVTPIFVDPDIDTNDFHLESNSACRDLSDTTSDYDDAGAYGGEGFDKVPDAIKITSIAEQNLPEITVYWSESGDYQIDGYKLYYDNKAIYSAAQDVYLTLEDREAALKVIDTGKSLSATISDLNTQALQPVAPTLSILPANNKLILTWNAVENATSYKVYYRANDDVVKTFETGNVTSYEIDGLSNEITYTVWLEAINQLSYYFQVVAYITAEADEFSESYFTKADTKRDIGSPVVSEASQSITIQPEAIVAYPVLPDGHCFIATAAFGYYDAQQVQVLRKFRDNYLKTNKIGRAFIDWYYRHGPYAASIINAHPVLKPMVRALLYPLVIMAELLEKTFVGFLTFIVACLLFIFPKITSRNPLLGPGNK
ncbi:MAG TPA: hypothetical protein ENK06_01670 [Gammaproteobacteria bacterium]|nr:hypothetical protein [Gammaproteobacteria bacterium]